MRDDEVKKWLCEAELSCVRSISRDFWSIAISFTRRILHNMKVLALFLCVAAVFVQSSFAKDQAPEARKEKIEAIASEATEAAFARKERSEAVLAAEDVPISFNLPPIVDARQALPRSHEAVVRRALAILCTAVKGEGLPQEAVEALIHDFGVWGDLSPEELAFVEDMTPDTFTRVQFAWRYEAAWVMLWAISAVEELEPPRQIVNVRAIGEIVRGKTVATLMKKTSLRPIDEILDLADLTYRYRWALVDARLEGREPPAGLDPGVALERHRALNWLIGYLGQDWDDVTPDT